MIKNFKLMLMFSSFLVALSFSEASFCMDLDDPDNKGTKRSRDEKDKDDPNKKRRLESNSSNSSSSSSSIEQETFPILNRFRITDSFVDELIASAKAGDRQKQDQAVWLYILDILPIQKVGYHLENMNFMQWENIEKRCLSNNYYAHSLMCPSIETDTSNMHPLFQNRFFEDQFLEINKENAAKGVAAAQYTLALYCLSADRYYKRAEEGKTLSEPGYKWLKMSADNDYGFAQWIYAQETNYSNSHTLHYARLAAQKGFPRAQEILANLWDDAKDKKSIRAVYELSHQAAIQGVDGPFSDVETNCCNISWVKFLMEKNSFLSRDTLRDKIFYQLPQNSSSSFSSSFEQALTDILGDEKTGLSAILGTMQEKLLQNNSETKISPFYIPQVYELCKVIENVAQLAFNYITPLYDAEPGFMVRFKFHDNVDLTSKKEKPSKFFKTFSLDGISFLILARNNVKLFTSSYEPLYELVRSQAYEKANTAFLNLIKHYEMAQDMVVARLISLQYLAPSSTDLSYPTFCQEFAKERSNSDKTTQSLTKTLSQLKEQHSNFTNTFTKIRNLAHNTANDCDDHFIKTYLSKQPEESSEDKEEN